MNIRTGSERGS